MRTVILDNEAVQALSDVTHAKHRNVLAHLVGIAGRRRRGDDVAAVVPTTVRAEAGWDRTDARSATINRLRIADRPLDGVTANLVASIIGRTGVSVADAHVGAVARGAVGDVVVLTSDPGDMVRVSSPTTITAVRI